MYKGNNKYGVLNDFDLSTIMNPGDRHPNRQGLERTGTLPFMAVELLKNEGFDGKIPRRYDHELESFSWVLVWVSRSVLSGQESQAPRRLHQWLNNSNDSVYMSKLAFIDEKGEIPTTSDYESWGVISDTWVDIWDDYRKRLKSLRTQTLAAATTDTEHLQVLIDACDNCAEEDPLAAVPIDVAWIHGLADLEFTPPSRLPTSPPGSGMGPPDSGMDPPDSGAGPSDSGTDSGMGDTQPPLQGSGGGPSPPGDSDPDMIDIYV